MISKSEARKYCFGYYKNDFKDYNQNIINQIRKDINYINAKTVALYYPMGHEVNLLELLKDDKIFLFPKIKEKRIMDFIIVNDETKWKINKFGINEPISGKILREGIDLFLISSLARNKNNIRLGHGGGYYDVYFSKPLNTVKIGILKSDLILDFKDEEHDIKLDYYISFKE